MAQRLTHGQIEFAVRYLNSKGGEYPANALGDDLVKRLFNELIDDDPRLRVAVQRLRVAQIMAEARETARDARARRPARQGWNTRKDPAALRRLLQRDAVLSRGGMPRGPAEGGTDRGVAGLLLRR